MLTEDQPAGIEGQNQVRHKNTVLNAELALEDTPGRIFIKSIEHKMVFSTNPEHVNSNSL
jgi:hypothetical protein